jgi:hypothetical protein
LIIADLRGDGILTCLLTRIPSARVIVPADRLRSGLPSPYEVTPSPPTTAKHNEHMRKHYIALVHKESIPIMAFPSWHHAARRRGGRVSARRAGAAGGDARDGVYRP